MRTCRWLSCPASTWTTAAGPRRPVLGPTKISRAPARTNRSTSACESRRSIWDASRGARSRRSSRVVDVHVEAVLMRRVPRAEPATPPSAEITDPDSPNGGVLAGIRGNHTEHDPDEGIRPPPPPGAIRPPVEKRIPREERWSTGGELDSPRQPPGGRSAESPRVVPANGPIRRRHEAGRYGERAGEPAGDDRQQDHAE